MDVREYLTADGKKPYPEWLQTLDVTPRARIQARVLRFLSGNLGDHKSVMFAIFSGTTTSRYLRSTTLRLERALSLLEAHEQRQAGTKRARRGKKDSRKSATLVPHGRKPAVVTDDQPDAETIDLIEDVVVSPEGIEPSTNRLRVCCSAS